MSATDALDALIVDLGNVLVEAATTRADTIIAAAVDQAISESARAVGEALRHQDVSAQVVRARDSIRRAGALIASLREETRRSRRIASIGAGLRFRGEGRRERR